MAKKALLLNILFLLSFHLFAQLAQDVPPIVINGLDENNIDAVYMPNIVNLKSALLPLNNDQIKHKPLKFAHPFEVNYNTKNSGSWLNLPNGISVWQLKIISKDAKSINLIFDNFELLPNARLYIYDPDRTKILGAFTAANNKSSKKFATYPIKDDEIIVQYEVETKNKNKHCFTIKKINHDYIGIVKDYNPRRPMNIAAGNCNIDINCIENPNIENIRDAVCRIIVNGMELCTGTLVNNTSNDKKPYILSAGHCFNNWDLPEVSIYSFNYQSPFCSNIDIDGDPAQAIAGAKMIAMSDSLDFALTELSVVPPKEFHPYYAGWNITPELYDSSYTIHHPYGDVKMIAFDDEAPTYSDYTDEFKLGINAFLEVGKWENGVTEGGSSGAALFNSKAQIIGTLTGGRASCSDPSFDYFARMHLAWDFYKEDTLQLKEWLDPINSNIAKLEGQRIYKKSEICQNFTNVEDIDNLQNVFIDENNKEDGYWGGNNTKGITEFCEKFVISNASTLNGISLGFGNIKKYRAFEPTTQVEIKIYSGNDFPENELFSRRTSINKLHQNAMNFFPIEPAISIPNTFFVGYKLIDIIKPDTINILQSINTSNKNFFYYKQYGAWVNFEESNPYSKMVNAIEVLCCNVTATDINQSELPLQDVRIYPNPTSGKVYIQDIHHGEIQHITLFDILGREIDTPINNIANNFLEVNLTNQNPGIYFIKVETDKDVFTQKVSYAP